MDRPRAWMLPFAAAWQLAACGSPAPLAPAGEGGPAREAPGGRGSATGDLSARARVDRADPTRAAPGGTALIGPITTVVSQLGDGGWTVGTMAGKGVLDFVFGPGTPPLGHGSLRLASPAGADKSTIQKLGSFGTIADFTASYHWYKNGGGVAAPALKLIIDTPDENPSWANFDKTLVYEPYQDGATATADGAWTAETISATQGGWWLVDYSTKPATKTFSPVRTLAAWLVERPAFAAGTIVSIEFGAGSGNPGLDGYVDDFSWGYRGAKGQIVNEVVDFE